MEDMLPKNKDNLAAEEIDDIDPAIFDDPILLLQWLDGKPPNSDSPSPPAGDITEEKVKAASVPSRRNKKANNSQSDTVLEIAHLVAIEELSMVGNFPEWLDARVSLDSKREILQACSIVEAYELLEAWCDKVTDTEDRAKLSIRMMEFIE